MIKMVRNEPMLDFFDRKADVFKLPNTNSGEAGASENPLTD